MTADPPWGEPYGLRQWYGHTYGDGSPIQVTNRQAQAFERLRVLLGYTEALTVYQGCHHHGSLSGTTHDKADVADLSAFEYQRKAKIGADIGLIVFYRPDNWNGAGGMEHLHTILRPSKASLNQSLRGVGPMDSVAAGQVLDWDQHTDGLYHADGKHTYLGPWYPVKPFVWHAKYDSTPDAPPAKPPIPWPLMMTAQQEIGDEIRALEAIVKAHPKMPQPKADLAYALERWRYYANWNR